METQHVIPLKKCFLTNNNENSAWTLILLKNFERQSDETPVEALW